MSRPDSFLLSWGARTLQPILLTLAIVTYYRGHHLPGGGFIAGLIAALSFMLIAMGDGVPAARARLRIDPVLLSALGLSLALGAALPGIIDDGTLLGGLWLPPFALPLLGEIHLGTPLLFDAGVFLTVTGFAVNVVFALMASSR